MWGLRGSRAATASVAAAVLAIQIVPVSIPPARAADFAPREIVITDDEAGRQAARAIDKDGEDDRSVWAQLRWERDQESADATTGPATIENVVWVAKDLASARAIYREQAKLNQDFPEAFYGRKGSFPFTKTKIGDEVSGASACLDCNAKEELRLHHRVTFRRGAVVSILYLIRRGRHDAAEPGDLVRDAGRRPGPRGGDEGARAGRRRAGRERRSRRRVGPGGAGEDCAGDGRAEGSGDQDRRGRQGREDEAGQGRVGRARKLVRCPF
jgi:hypothetical protein